jgi:hypothetical protein
MHACRPDAGTGPLLASLSKLKTPNKTPNVLGSFPKALPPTDVKGRSEGSGSTSVLLPVTYLPTHECERTKHNHHIINHHIFIKPH